MPLLNISLQKGKDAQYIKTLSTTIHQALMDTWHIPENDYFQLIHEVEADHFFIDRHMWNMNRTDDVIIIHITSAPRTSEMKRDFYRELPLALGKALGLSHDDVFISIITNQPEDWSFGQGQAQLLTSS